MGSAQGGSAQGGLAAAATSGGCGGSGSSSAATHPALAAWRCSWEARQRAHALCAAAGWRAGSGSRARRRPGWPAASAALALPPILCWRSARARSVRDHRLQKAGSPWVARSELGNAQIGQMQTTARWHRSEKQCRCCCGECCPCCHHLQRASAMMLVYILLVHAPTAVLGPLLQQQPAVGTPATGQSKLLRLRQHPGPPHPAPPPARPAAAAPAAPAAPALAAAAAARWCPWARLRQQAAAPAGAAPPQRGPPPAALWSQALRAPAVQGAGRRRARLLRPLGRLAR